MGGSWHSPVGGIAAPGHARCSPAPSASSTTSPLLGFGLVLRGQGWRIGYLGADTPVASVVEAAEALAPDAVVVSGTVTGVFDPIAVRLREVAVHAPLYVSGAAATQQIAERAHGTLLDHDLVTAAETLARRRP